jgi:S-adenosylmethionine uptake transporter
MRERANSTAIPYAVATLGIASFSIMDAVMKQLVLDIGAYNAMLWRVVVGSILGGLVFLAVGPIWPTWSTLRRHAWRNCVTSVMTLSFFWGIGRVPLAEGIALSFIAPLITLYLAALLLDEKIGRAAMIASALGIAGVAVILAGKLGATFTREAQWGVAAILLAAVLYAYNLILQRQLSQIASPLEIVFFQGPMVLAIFLLALMICQLAYGVMGAPPPFAAVLPDIAHLPGIVASAVLAFISLFAISWAYARAETQLLVTSEYSAFIWAAILGWIYFDEQLTIATLVGTGLIVIGCTVAARERPVP